MPALAHIDGPNGAGKTTLRRAVAKALQTHAVHVYSVGDAVVRRSARLSRSYTHARDWFIRRACKRGADVVLVERGLASHLVFDHLRRLPMRAEALRQCALTCPACRMHSGCQHWVLLAGTWTLRARLGRRHAFEPALPVHQQVQAYGRAARAAGLTMLRLRTKRQLHLAAAQIAQQLMLT